jgi:replicative DNA helicase
MEFSKNQSLRLGSKTRPMYNQNLDERLGKIPPQALDLEEAVLGALMLEKDALTNVIDILKPDTFYKDSHKEIYSSIVDLFNNSEPVDILTVTNHLRKTGNSNLSGALIISLSSPLK